ncbi:Uncharacterized protein TCM_043445 isoform 2, partial [Theobroma cacao]
HSNSCDSCEVERGGTRGRKAERKEPISTTTNLNREARGRIGYEEGERKNVEKRERKRAKKVRYSLIFFLSCYFVIDVYNYFLFLPFFLLTFQPYDEI